LPIALLEQIASRFRGVSEGILRMGLLPCLELGTGLRKLEFVENPKAGVQLWNVQTPGSKPARPLPAPLEHQSPQPRAPCLEPDQ